MDTLMQRFLDGDLTAREAAFFEARLAAEPAFAAELRAWESAMAQLAAPVRLSVSRLTGRVPTKPGSAG